MTTDLVPADHNNNVITTSDADWLAHLAENVVAVIVEHGFSIRQLYIHMYWHMGKEIVDEMARQREEYLAFPDDSEPPVSLNWIVENLSPYVEKYQGLIGTSKTALYDASRFYDMCPTEEERDRLLETVSSKLGKTLTWRDICRKLLPGHELDEEPQSRYTMLYSGPGKLYLGDFGVVMVQFPRPMNWRKRGGQVNITVREVGET